MAVKHLTSENRSFFLSAVAQGRPVDLTVKYMLECIGVTLRQVGKEADNVSSAYVKRTLQGLRSGQKVRKVVQQYLGFDPLSS